jgi:hypothetical protein
MEASGLDLADLVLYRLAKGADMPLLGAISVHRSFRTSSGWSLATVNFARVRDHAR